MLPDEIISEILSPALKVPEDLFSDTSETSPFSNYAPSTSVYLLVCKDWLRVATPLLYSVVVLRSKAQAKALETVLKTNPEFGRFIQKLRVEGGYGSAMHTILKSTPNITDLVLSLSIWSSDSTSGLCKGLPLIDPRRVIVLHPSNLKNKQADALAKRVFECFRSWDKMHIFGYPYGSCSFPHNAAQEMSGALRGSQVHTIILSSVFSYVPQHIISLGEIHSLKVLRFQRPFYNPYYSVRIPLNPHKSLHFAQDFRTWTSSSSNQQPATTTEPEITPSLNPYFVPMGSASEETRERVWKRVLFFVMAVEETRSADISSHPSRLAVLCVSRYFHRLGLPYFYESLLLTPRSVEGIRTNLEKHPHLGPLIRRIFAGASTSAETAMVHILNHATHLEVLVPAAMYQTNRMSKAALGALETTAGRSLQELSISLSYTVLSPSDMEQFTALRVLEIGGRKLQAEGLESPRPDALKMLHTLRIHDNFFAQFMQLFADMRLER